MYCRLCDVKYRRCVWLPGQLCGVPHVRACCSKPWRKGLLVMLQSSLDWRPCFFKTDEACFVMSCLASLDDNQLFSYNEWLLYQASIFKDP